jgi:hypothetical protein
MAVVVLYDESQIKGFLFYTVWKKLLRESGGARCEGGKRGICEPGF